MRMRSNANAVECECGRIRLNADVCGWIQRIWLNAGMLKRFVVVAAVCSRDAFVFCFLLLVCETVKMTGTRSK